MGHTYIYMHIYMWENMKSTPLYVMFQIIFVILPRIIRAVELLLLDIHSLAQPQETAGAVRQDAYMHTHITAVKAGMSNTLQSHAVPSVAGSAVLCFSHYFNYWVSKY